VLATRVLCHHGRNVEILVRTAPTRKTSCAGTIFGPASGTSLRARHASIRIQLHFVPGPSTGGPAQSAVSHTAHTLLASRGRVCYLLRRRESHEQRRHLHPSRTHSEAALEGKVITGDRACHARGTPCWRGVGRTLSLASRTRTASRTTSRHASRGDLPSPSARHAIST
jgi:hypothetical protein